MKTGLARGLWHYGGAVFVIILATLARLLLDPVLGDNTPFITFFPAVALVAWLCGSGPALVAAFCATLAITYFFFPPRFSFLLHRHSDYIALALFLGYALVTAALSEQVGKARRRGDRKQKQLLDEIDQRRKAESALAQQRESWRATIACIGDGVLVTDASGKVTFLNSVAETLTGWTEAQAVGLPLDRVFHIISEADRHPANNPVLGVLQSGKIQGLANHTILVSRDGSERSIDDSAAPIRGPGGQLLGVVLVFRDITQRRAQEQRLQQSEARFAAFVDHAPAAIFIKDPCGKHLLVNSLFERLAGMGRDRLLGMADTDIYPADVAERFRQIDQRILASGQAETFEESFQHGGQAYTFLTTKFALFDADGRTCALCGIATDITDRKRNQDALRKSEHFHKAIADLTADYAFAGHIHADGTVSIDTVTEGFARFYGSTLEQVNARGGWASVIHPDDHPLVAAIIERLRAGQSDHGEIRGLTGNNLVKWQSFLVAPVQEGNGQGTGFLGAARDISRQRQAELTQQELTDRLRRQAGSLSAILSASVDHIYLLDSQCRYQYVSVGGAGVLGLTPDQMTGKHWRDLGLPADVMEPFAAQWQHVLETGEVMRQEVHFRTASGQVRHYEYLIAPVLGDRGQVDSVVVVSRDDTERKRAEEALAESTAILRSFYDTTPLMMGVVEVLDEDVLHLKDNSATGKFLGLSPEALRNRLASQSGVSPQHLRRWIGHYRESARTGQPVRFEYAHETPRANYWLSATVAAIETTPQGRLRCSYVVEDITERKRAEDALRQADRSKAESLALLDTLQHNAPVGFAFVDRQFRYVRVNQALAAINGKPVAEHLGNRVEDTNPSLWAQLRPLYQRVLETGEPILDQEITGESPAARGQTRHWLVSYYPVRVHDELAGIGILVVDVTGRKRAEEASRFLAESSAALSALVDYEATLEKVAHLAVPYFADWCAVDMVREDGQLHRLAVAHRDPAGVQLVHDLTRRYPPSPESSGTYRVLRTGVPEIVPEITDDMLVRGARDDEHLRLIRSLCLKSYICVPLVVSGSSLGVLIFATSDSGRTYTSSDLDLAQDLAHRAAVAVENARLYRALKEADRRKDEFLATLAHELRNPLAPIRNALQVLRLAGNNSQQAELSRGMMERQLAQMVRLVDDLLDVSRITRNKLELRKEKVELTAVIAGAVETSRPLIDQMSHQLTLTLPPQPVYLHADPTRLAQVFSNLLNNAAKYTERGGLIQLGASLLDGGVVVSVRDNGVGVPAEALPQLFEMFSQLDRNLERAQGGLGIGLTLVRRLVEMHGGTVAARSDGPGKGSEFVVRLPVLPEPADRGSAVPREDERAVAPSRRILVVDDNRDSAMSLDMMLSLLGHQTKTAHDGEEALETAEAFRPDVILLDIGLPRLNGYDVCRRVRQQPWGKEVFIIACTGWGQEEDRRRSSEAGFDQHLVKPIDLAHLRKWLLELGLRT